MRALAALILAATPLAAADVPSGQPVSLHEMLVETRGDVTSLRFRFLTPEIDPDGAARSYDDVLPDFAHLCETFAIPYMAQYQLHGDTIVISFMDRVTEFGKAAPEATQFFEAFTLKDSACMWEDF